jgi:exoribonuclease-2
MLARGLEPDFPAAIAAELRELSLPTPRLGSEIRDLRDLLWCSIDNDDSRDLDQLTVAESLPDSRARIFVSIADVSAAVAAGSALEHHAETNTTSVYTPPKNFPMLPDRLSTDLTSLVESEDRLSIVVDVLVDAQGRCDPGRVYQALVRNHAKLAYSGVGAWLEGDGPLPAAAGRVPGLAENLRLQDAAAQRLKALRHAHGALELETFDVRALFEGDEVRKLVAEPRNRAKELIEDFMIAANGAIAQFLAGRRFPVMRRVVRSPERWQRIVEIARGLGEPLPGEPDAKALNEFLLKRRAADPVRFPDLSLTVIKLLGRGEYVASFPEEEETAGHFGLAVREYTHSTAPNRRYPDLITQRMIKAALTQGAVPYARDRLVALAAHCTLMEDNAQKVERLVRKATAACLLSRRVGEEFDGIVSGASPKGTWVRIFDPPIEGRVVRGEGGLDVGDRVRVQLIHTDPERGFIDFAGSGPAQAAARNSDGSQGALRGRSSPR